MDTEVLWEGHNILMQTQPSLRFLWLAAETVIKVDNTEIGRSKGFGRSGGWGFYEKVDGDFIHNGTPTKVLLELKADLITLISVPYKLQVNGNVVSQGRLKINNWVLFFVPVVIFICICCLAVMLFWSLAPSNLPTEVQSAFWGIFMKN